MTQETDAAFSRPVSETHETRAEFAPSADGLTKLEYFTAAALTGILAADTDGYMTYEKAAAHAVKQAREVIRELNAEAGA